MFRFDPAAGQYRAEQSQAMTWMTRIVRDRCIDRLRRPDIEPPGSAPRGAPTGPIVLGGKVIRVRATGRRQRAPPRVCPDQATASNGSGAPYFLVTANPKRRSS
ncbi:hypothetical protein ACOTFH_21150 [Achromobacter xylosoxidans]